MQLFRKSVSAFRVLFGGNILSRSHCRSTTTWLDKMRIRLEPALEDNYMYLLIDDETKQCAVVDPVEPEKILKAVKEENVKLTCVLTTHHHWDHAGGNEKLIAQTGKIPVYGGDDRIGALTDKVSHNTEFKLGNLNIKCLFTPCHTAGHICYYVTGNKADPAVFTGDTLFSGGCGRFFEGTPPQMYSALIEILSSLPGETRVFCGHEYTTANLKFAIHTEPANVDIQNKIKSAQNLRDNNLPTIPSTIDEEKKINPFMRVQCESVKKHCGCTDPIEVMGYLRKEKDTFKPT
ncbi:hydroxyacylglutathione hydrolase, mitochondrial-like [Ruditapes philippinarum]|uniref:hydroxyacylglutathione hydrolase, mitochondrial-like n=1 Tax=Ruditapes philippinarum TaxID=129788 RepID=UPI00295B70D8|nr:hydroxyacylglutathione hydrolase, mitochondrial-like [Ruditapes philippinarum]